MIITATKWYLNFLWNNKWGFLFRVAIFFLLTYGPGNARTFTNMVLIPVLVSIALLNISAIIKIALMSTEELDTTFRKKSK